MVTRRFPFGIAVGLLLIGLPAWAVRCPDGILAKGESQDQVVAKCGQPSLAEQRLDERLIVFEDGTTLAKSVSVDEWLFDFGPSRLMVLLVFHDGRLAKWKTRGRGLGLAMNELPDRPRIVSTGDYSLEVLLRWGDPTSAERRRIPRTSFGRRRETITRVVTVDVWVYRFGADRLARILTFENGRLVSERTGGRG